MTSNRNGSQFFVPQTDDDLSLVEDDNAAADSSHQRLDLKRKRIESESESIALPPPLASTTTAATTATTSTSTESKSSIDETQSAKQTTTETVPLLRHFSHVCAVNIDETLLENAELSGTNLAVKLMGMGADSILEEIHQHVVVIPTP